MVEPIQSSKVDHLVDSGLTSKCITNYP